MKNNILIICFVLMSLIFLTSCDNTSTSKAPPSGFIGGIEGISASFAPESPPAKVYDANTQPFQIALLVENKGEHTIAPGELLATVEGIDESTFQITKPTQSNPSTIEKVTKDSAGKLLVGGKSMDISFDAKYKTKVSASEPYTIGINLCYLYQTESQTRTCLRKDILARPSTTDVCKIDDPKTTSGSGAPVQVTSISERPAGINQIRLLVEIENKGKGEVYDPSYLSKGSCFSDYVSGVQNQVKVKIYFPDNSPAIKCERFNNGAEGKLLLINNKKSFDCFVDTASLQQSTFEKPVHVQLDYVYKDRVSKQLIVDKSM